MDVRMVDPVVARSRRVGKPGPGFLDPPDGYVQAESVLGGQDDNEGFPGLFRNGEIDGRLPVSRPFGLEGIESRGNGRKRESSPGITRCLSGDVTVTSNELQMDRLQGLFESS